MFSRPLSRRLNGYRERITHEYSMWDHRRSSARNLRNYEHWIQKLQNNPPDVFLGPDLPYGGVRGHVRAIREYSDLNVQLVPDESVMGGLGNFTAEIREHFMEFNPTGSPTVHSHVLPWMIHWCHKQQQRGLLWIHTYHLPYFPEHGKESLRPDQIEINDALIHGACHADVRLSVSRWQQEFLKVEHGIETDYLPNGVDVNACDLGDAERFRRSHHFAGPFLLYVGRNDPVKNPADFVRLALAMPALRFVMIGGGLTTDTLREEWQVDAPANLTLPGPASHAGVQDAIAACSVLVVTSKREGLPTLVMEGMAHQKPVVVPDEAGCMEAIGDGEFAYIYQQGNIDDLVAKAELAMKDSSIGLRARQRVLEEYDWRVVTPRLDAIYQGVTPS
jgi:glycosyltransferase involved in cell wall biosynthesis